MHMHMHTSHVCLHQMTRGAHPHMHLYAPTQHATYHTFLCLQTMSHYTRLRNAPHIIRSCACKPCLIIRAYATRHIPYLPVLANHVSFLVESYARVVQLVAIAFCGCASSYTHTHTLHLRIRKHTLHLRIHTHTHTQSCVLVL